MKNMHKRVIGMIMLSIMTLSTAQAYDLTNWRLTDNLKYIPHKDFSSQSIDDFNDALYIWNKELPDDIQMTRSTKTHNDSDFIEKDGKNYVYRLAEFDTNTDYVGRNRVVSKKTSLFGYKKVTESDINFNMNYKFSNSGKAGTYDVFSVFLHETGHTLGLDDIRSPKSAVMYEKAVRGEQRRSLTRDDKDGLKDAYELN